MTDAEHALPKVDNRPVCPVCNEWRLTQLGPLFVCAGCECAWEYWQLLAAADAARRDRSEHALLISDEELAEIERRPYHRADSVFAKMAARIRELEAQPQVNEAGVIAAMLQYLADMEQMRQSALAKLTELVAQQEQAGA